MIVWDGMELIEIAIAGVGLVACGTVLAEATERAKRRRRVMTNADKYFRNATDEEIASFLAAVNNHRQWSEQTLMQDLDADYAYYLEWLKQEVEE